MKRTLFTLGAVLLLVTSCKQNSNSKTIREGEPDVYNINASDSKMNEAIENAKKSVDVFQNVLISENPDFEYFSIKQKFNTPQGGEHIWVQDITFVDSQFVGIIGNEPVNTNEISLGNTIIVDKNKISDWMYFDKGIVRGGYTIKVLRDEMTVEEQKLFDLESGLIFK
jgi:uncharacterized protein YegJ (DUF2314 family)